jgi:GT2 family glycosyltransferase
MEEKINVSICIANFNGLDIIDACVESVLIQKNIANIEIIIHDDFSTDSSVNLIKEKYKDIKLIESESNVGFCVANNRMATCAKGEYLLFLNNDAELFSDAVETLLTATQAADVPTIFGLPQYATDTHELIDCGAFIDPFFNAVPNQTLRQAEVAMVAGACLWVPKKIWVELGGFPEWFESIAEDLYLCCRARLAGYSVVALGTSGFYHRVGNSFGG